MGEASCACRSCPKSAARLQLGPMVDRNTAPHQTPYTVPVDHVSCRTGISAEERARTVQAIIDPATRPDDLVRPGHLFPLVAKEGGVLRRAGHTEATVDLARLAGLAPAGILCEVLDGTGVASRRRLHEIAREHDLPIVSIEGLIRYRRHPRKTGAPRRRGRLAHPLWQRTHHRLSRAARAEQRAGRHRDGRSAHRSRPRSYGCTLRALPATCSTRYGAIAATSFTWPWR